MTHDSARPCGYNPGAKWTCEQHRGSGNVIISNEETDALLLDCLQTGIRRAKMVEAASYGDCTQCDGYVLLKDEAPLCPTCARFAREGQTR